MKRGFLSGCVAAGLMALTLAPSGHAADQYAFQYRLEGMASSDSWTLGSASLPLATSGSPYAYDFSNLISPSGLSGLTWSATDLPDWLSLDTDLGQISGTPSASDIGSQGFTIVATRLGVDGQQIYTIEVGGQILEVSQISLGDHHACAVTAAGGAKCWGRGGNGRLGNNDSVNSAVPVDVYGLTSGVAMIEAGDTHTCAVTTSGAAKCWGYGAFGQLGSGNADSSLVPVDVVGLSAGVGKLSTGFAHTCAVMTSGDAKCWGYNYYGQLGDGSNNSSLVPVDVSGLGGQVAGISAGYGHTCAVTTAGAAKCWGSGGMGKLGNNDTSNSYVPVDVSGLGSGVSVIDASVDHTCAVVSGGAKCWGSGAGGRLGNNSTSWKLVPTDVYGLTTGVSHIDAGYGHSCALTAAGGAKCWGIGSNGRLGNNATSNSLVPVDVEGLSSGVSDLAAGMYHGCAVMAGGGVKCWGAGSYGQLGNGSTDGSLIPVGVLF